MAYTRGITNSDNPLGLTDRAPAKAKGQPRGQRKGCNTNPR